MMIKRKSTYED
jgi:hypothetical protein